MSEIDRSLFSENGVFAPYKAAELFQLAAEMSPVPTMLISCASGDIAWANAAANALMPRRGVDLPGEWFSPDFKQTLATAAASLPIGESCDVLVNVTESKDRHFKILRESQWIVAVDLTDVQPTSHHDRWDKDPLTGLLNRKALENRLRETIQDSVADWGLLFIDLDNFKRVNDQLGHLAGDRVLAKVAATLQSSARPTDDIFRFGGDEFIVLVRQLASEDDLDLIATRIRHEVHFEVDGLQTQLIHITASIGHAKAWKGLRNSEEIIARADRAMYRSKAPND